MLSSPSVSHKLPVISEATEDSCHLLVIFPHQQASGTDAKTIFHEDIIRETILYAYEYCYAISKVIDCRNSKNRDRNTFTFTYFFTYVFL